jgi:hypothetical protein
MRSKILALALARPEYFCEWMLTRFPCLLVSHVYAVLDRAYRFFGEDGAARGPLDNEGIVTLQQCQLE